MFGDVSHVLCFFCHSSVFGRRFRAIGFRFVEVAAVYLAGRMAALMRFFTRLYGLSTKIYFFGRVPINSIFGFVRRPYKKAGFGSCFKVWGYKYHTVKDINQH